ncbi:hypothetical protein OG775_22970 [Streptomyces platensis]|uniref:hypothetical protein n=1 Tax=Streptomyces platensis TaxID=58346 RepID=UPI002250CABB|nr:hypothetical protein [Streptomyces platensis]MCX4637956.1 hypothetical protein [Streptomyces platensis]
MTANYQIAFHILRRESMVADVRLRVGVDPLNATRNQRRRFTFATGQGYLLGSHQRLHAPTEVSGNRRWTRALGEPRLAQARGFTDRAAAPLPVLVATAQ